MARRAVFLDRDGVINEVVFRDGKLSAPYNMAEFKILPRVKEALAMLKAKEFLCIVVTNQPDAGKHFDFETLQAMHQRLKDKLGVDKVYSCSHGENSDCTWYKPRPGMILAAVEKFDIDLTQSFVIGDRWRDMDLGKNAGCRTVLVVSEATIFDGRQLTRDFTAGSLYEAIEIIVKLNAP